MREEQNSKDNAHTSAVRALTEQENSGACFSQVIEGKQGHTDKQLDSSIAHAAALAPGPLDSAFVSHSSWPPRL